MLHRCPCKSHTRWCQRSVRLRALLPIQKGLFPVTSLTLHHPWCKIPWERHYTGKDNCKTVLLLWGYLTMISLLTITVSLFLPGSCHPEATLRDSNWLISDQQGKCPFLDHLNNSLIFFVFQLFFCGSGRCSSTPFQRCRVVPRAPTAAFLPFFSFISPCLLFSPSFFQGSSNARRWGINSLGIGP